MRSASSRSALIARSSIAVTNSVRVSVLLHSGVVVACARRLLAALSMATMISTATSALSGERAMARDTERTVEKYIDKEKRNDGRSEYKRKGWREWVYGGWRE